MLFTDQTGRQINIPFSPKRIISVVPSQTELLFWLGLSERIAGITKFCVHPENLCSTKTKAGGTKKLDLAIIRDLQPDLIIANKEENERQQIEELMRDFPVWISDVNDLESALAMIRSIGEMTGTLEKAMEVISRIQNDFATLIQAHTYKTAYFIWRKPYMVAGSDTFINDMLKRCGFINVYANRSRYPEINADELAQAEPELILLSSEPYPFNDKHISELQAICPSARIILVDGEMFSWYGSRLLYSVKYFKELLADV